MKQVLVNLVINKQFHTFGVKILVYRPLALSLAYKPIFKTTGAKNVHKTIV